MRRTSRLATHSMVLIVAISLWLRPFCLLPELDVADHGSATLSEQDHSQHPVALCDDHLLHAAGIGHDAEISAKAGVLTRVPLAGVPHNRFSTLRRSGLDIASLPAPHSLSLPASELYVLHSVYLI